MKKILLSFCALILLTGLVIYGCNGSSDDGAVNAVFFPTYSADIRWTSYGIPHIKADNLASASFGSGYAFAKLNACVLADQILMVKGERSKYFGPDKATAGDSQNLISDLFYKGMDALSLGQAYYDRQTDENKSVLDGYLAGYNKYLKEVGAAGLPCSSQPGIESWGIPASMDEYGAFLVDFTWLGGPKPLMAAIVNAQPPASDSADIPGLGDKASQGLEDLLAGETPGASNGWAVGRDRTAYQTGMLLGNPHYPWEGERRFFESQITVPGEINVYGSTLLGLPVPGIAFNANVAWTHTVCTSRHFTFYMLTLKSGDPTTYIYDGEEIPMTSRQVTVQVQQADGSLVPVTQTFYSSHFGPMVEIPGQLDWTDTMGLDGPQRHG